MGRAIRNLRNVALRIFAVTTTALAITSKVILLWLLIVVFVFTLAEFKPRKTTTSPSLHASSAQASARLDVMHQSDRHAGGENKNSGNLLSLSLSLSV